MPSLWYLLSQLDAIYAQVVSQSSTEWDFGTPIPFEELEGTYHTSGGVVYAWPLQTLRFGELRRPGAD
jgi:hypothetical protein